jgi:hypothetical protein
MSSKTVWAIAVSNRLIVSGLPICLKKEAKELIKYFGFSKTIPMMDNVEGTKIKNS